MKKLSALATFAVLLAAPALARVAAQPVSVVAAENFYGDIAKQIGGPDVKVTSILSNPDQDPYLFEVSPSVGRDVSAARIVIYNRIDYLTDTTLIVAYNGDERLPWRRLSARQPFSSLRSFGPTGRAGNTAMASERSGQGRRNRLLAALTSADHSLLAPHLKELSLELGSLLQEAGEPVEQIPSTRGLAAASARNAAARARPERDPIR
jgi:hypothetical protein